MNSVPGAVETERGPPIGIPLGHFLVGFALLLFGALVGVGAAPGTGPAAVGVVHVHLLLAGWVCVTIMGAMTQFVPVWSGVTLYSRRLASAQLPLVTVGLLGFAGAVVVGRPALLPVAALPMLVGFWAFVYNVGRTLARVSAPDVTETHFAVALAFFAVVPLLGYLLAVDFSVPVFKGVPVSRTSVRAAHATLAVFGAVLTTVLGALYQLATMFTQSELRGVDVPVRRFETVAYPVGVVALAAGRLVSNLALARAGGLLVVAGLFGFGVVLARRLHEARVARTPLLSRYAVVAAATVSWALVTLPAWLRDPLAPNALFGAPGSAHLLFLGTVAFVVLGTLYHVVPFLVWVERYSDRLGLEDVPMVDDLYSDRLAAADFALLLAGSIVVVAADALTLPDWVAPLGGGLVVVGGAVAVANLLLVVRRHAPRTFGVSEPARP